MSAEKRKNPVIILPNSQTRKSHPPPDMVRRDYLELSQRLNLKEVAAEGVRLAVEAVETTTTSLALLHWEKDQHKFNVLANYNLQPATLDLLPAVDSLQSLPWPGVYQTQMPDVPANLQPLFNSRQRSLTYFPLGLTDLSGLTFTGGLLVLSLDYLPASNLAELLRLCEILDPALCNAAEYGRILSQYHMMVAVRKTWEQLWVSVDEQQRSIERMLSRNQALHDIGLAINSSLKIKEVLSTIVRETVRLVRASRGAIALWDETSQQLTVMAEYKLSSQDGVATFPAAAQPPTATVEHELHFPSDLSKTASASLRKFLKTTWMVAGENSGITQISPLRWHREIVGLILLNDDTPGRIFSKDDLETISLISGQATVAIQNARLFDAVAEERNRSRAILDSIADGVFTTDLEQRITTVNPAALRLSGYRAEELAGQAYLPAFSISDRTGQPLSPEMSPLLQVIQQSTSTEPRIFLIKRGGKKPGEALIALAAAPILDENGAISGSVGVFRDVTQEQEISRLKDELVSLVSHELRTPMASVLGFSELMLTRQLSESKARMYVETIHKEAQRLSNLINDFLDIQRMEAGSQIYNYSEVNLEILMRRTLDVFSQHQHRLQVELAPGLPLVKADPDRIFQALTNLVSNAIKYSPAGGAVRLEARLNQDNMVELAVKDCGLGIPEEAQSQLFSKFYRVDNSDRRSIGGTGLGLAISREIIEAHGGKIWVESILGEGSAFYFTLYAILNEDRPAQFSI